MKKSSITLKTLVLVLFLLCIPTIRGQSGKADIREYRRARERALKERIPFDMDMRMDLYVSMDQLPRFLMEKLKPTLLRSSKASVQGQVYWLAFYDFDGDDLPDKFALQTHDKKVMPDDFGFLYDLNRDGETDYIIYNGGSMITGSSPFYHYFYHWIDSNFDGKIDVIAYVHVIYSEGSRPDPTKVFWIMDRDGNGAPDLVDFTDNKDQSSHPIELSEGVWTYRTLFGLKTIDPEDKAYFDLYNQYLEAVMVLSRG